jgi:hypothetical protein
MQGIYGVGARKLEKYGELFLNIIREYKRVNSAG